MAVFALLDHNAGSREKISVCMLWSGVYVLELSNRYVLDSY